MLRRLLPIAVLLCYIGIFGNGAADAEALPMSRCTTSYGVVVAVDFGHWGGPIVRGCGSTPTSGYQLVNQGGFATTGTRHDGPGFICRISYAGYRNGDGQPADQTCINTPPSGASWSYWSADPGQRSWTLVPKGAADTYPGNGAVQAWAFGGSPSFSPDSVRAHNNPPAGRSSSAPVPHSSSPAAHRSGAGSGPAPAAASSAGHSAATHQAGSAVVRATASASRSTGFVSVLPRVIGTSTSPPNIVDAQADASTRPRSSGSAWPVVVGGGFVLALAGLAGFTVRQRRRAG
ncbi:MAG TPA: hypothetical protein VFU36_06495 [Jatrophihabitans sp.]|nr:hypothetical protein [Jatrophihabitans sp.]